MLERTFEILNIFIIEENLHKQLFGSVLKPILLAPKAAFDLKYNLKFVKPS